MWISNVVKSYLISDITGLSYSVITDQAVMLCRLEILTKPLSWKRWKRLTIRNGSATPDGSLGIWGQNWPKLRFSPMSLRGSMKLIWSWGTTRLNEPGWMERRVTCAERRTTPLPSAKVRPAHKHCPEWDSKQLTVTTTAYVLPKVRNIATWLLGLQKKLNDMNNLMKVKEEKLRGRHRDTHAALQWLRQNRNRFKGNVYEPMLLEVSRSHLQTPVLFKIWGSLRYWSFVEVTVSL